MNKKDLLVNKELEYLIVWEGTRKKKVGSEIKPVYVGSSGEQEYEKWENGPTTYHRYIQYTYWVIRWNDDPVLIEMTEHTGSFPNSELDDWRIVSKLPANILVENID